MPSNKDSKRSETDLSNDGASLSKNFKNNRGLINQILVTGAMLILTAARGMPIGYSAILLPQLTNTTDPLELDVGMASWIASIHSAATPFGSFSSGPIMDGLGRKTALLISILPLIGGWLCIALASSHTWLLVGRVFAGLSAGLINAPVQVYLAEIADPSIRGVLTAAPIVAYSMGVLLVYGLGYAFNWRVVAWCSIILPTISFLAVIFIPESPNWLIRHNLPAKAAAALTFLRGDEDKAKRELQQLTHRYEHEKSHMTVSKERFFDILKKKSVLKPLVIINTFNMLQLLSGVYLVVLYAVHIVDEFAGDDVSPEWVSVLTAVIRLCFTVLFCFLLIYSSRRKISIISGLGSAIAAISLAIIFYSSSSGDMSDALRFISFVLLSIYIGCNTGYLLLPGIMVGELLPARIRGRVAGLIICLFNIGLFIQAKAYPQVKDDLKTSGLFLVFGLASLLAVILIYTVLPETKGQTLSAIEDHFAENPWLWARRRTRMDRQEKT